MTNGRCFGRLAAAAVILLATALPGAADGVSQFEQKIRPQLPPNFLTYAKAKALGDNGFVLEDVVVTADGIGGAKAEPVAIKRVTVDHFDFAGLDKGVPLFLKIRVEGITVASKPVAGVDLNELAGVDAIMKQATTILDGMRAGQSEATLAVFDALGSFLVDYKHPKGPLKITVNPPNKASAAALSDIKSPNDAVKALGLVVTYGG